MSVFVLRERECLPFVTSQMAQVQDCRLHSLKQKYDGLFIPSGVVHFDVLVLELKPGK